MQFLHKAELVKLDFTTTVNPYCRGFQRKYKYRVIESIRLQGWSQCGLILGRLRSPKASLEPQGRAQITLGTEDTFME